MSENNRYSFLDSTRGLAAFIVLLAHTIKTFAPKFFNSLFSFIWDSQAAVLYFFILSGFVLTVSIKSTDLLLKTYTSFAARRILRIYPAFIIVLLLAFCFYPFFNYPVNSWLNEYWQNNFSIPKMFKQVILIFRIPNEPAERILPHDWTLSIEIMISLLLPFLVWIAKKKSWLIIILVFLMVKILPIDSFIFDFTLGIFIAIRKEFLIGAWKKIGYLGHVIGLLLALFLLQIDRILPAFSLVTEQFLVHSKSWGLSIMLIAIISSSRLQNLLDNKFLIFQGKISYSLYLIHLILIGILYKFLPDLNVVPALLFIYSTSLLLSAFLYKTVEKPMIQIGKNGFWV